MNKMSTTRDIRARSLLLEVKAARYANLSNVRLSRAGFGLAAERARVLRDDHMLHARKLREEISNDHDPLGKLETEG